MKKTFLILKKMFVYSLTTMALMIFAVWIILGIFSPIILLLYIFK